METRSVLSSGLGGKDVVIVASREELAAPSKVALPEPEPAPGLILPDGSINWGCPCLGGMATGPCSTQFRDAFSCFHYRMFLMGCILLGRPGQCTTQFVGQCYSEAEPKGSDCYEKFSVMQECMAGYPALYGRDDDEDDLAAAIDASAGAGDRPADASADPSADQTGPADAGDK